MITRNICLLILCGEICYGQGMVLATATFVVRNDMEQIVSDAELKGWFGDISNEGAHDRFAGFTGTNGIYVANGKALTDACAIVRAAGHYDSLVRKRLEHDERMNIDRWDVEIPVLLRRIRNPIPLFAKGLEYMDFKTTSQDKMGKYTLSSKVGYDLIKGDMLPPFGLGSVSDLEFVWKMVIISRDSDGLAVDYETHCEIRTPNTGDGICKGTPYGDLTHSNGSAFISDYDAPLEGYKNAIVIFRNVRNRKLETNDDQHYLYYFRVRSQTNELGQVTNALYGKIYGQINGHFTYYINPTPNDRNIEFDPKRNLFSGLPPLEQAKLP